jgi:hypothetical protein
MNRSKPSTVGGGGEAKRDTSPLTLDGFALLSFYRT